MWVTWAVHWANSLGEAGFTFMTVTPGQNGTYKA